MKRKAAEEDEWASKRAKLGSRNGNDLEIPSEPKKASLLGLPAELRNEILAHVLTPHEDYPEPRMVTAMSHQQPGVLRTNHQLRNEGLAMFLDCAHFAIDIHGLKLEPHLGHWVFQIPNYQPYMYFQGARSSSNLKAWLRMYFEDQTIPRILKPNEPELYFEGTISQPFTIIETLAKCGTPWKAVEKVIDAYMEGVQSAHCSRVDIIWEA